MPPAYIRWMIRRDMAEVVDIEHRAFPYPWTEEDFIKALRERNVIGQVAEVEDKVVGYMIYELRKGRIQLLNLAVDIDYRRQGIGTQLLNMHVKRNREAKNQHKRKIVTAVCEMNLDAQKWLASRGFRALCILREYWRGSDRDAYVMVKSPYATE